MSEPGQPAQIRALDLSACAREPIHIPGSIQPHGVLFLLSASDHTVLQVSENTAAHLGVEPDQLLGRSLQEAMPGAEWSRLEEALAQPDPAAESPVRVIAVRKGARRSFDALLHRIEGALVLELEPVAEQDATEMTRFLRQVRVAIEELQAAETDAKLFAACASAVSRLTGFERVMVYRFDEDWNGEVVGEQLIGDADSYMGLHFPASDIPEQARALYARTPLRIIPDASYQPAPLRPELNPLTQRPLDLSNAALRSVSPVHLEYLRNMGVQASMSISLMRGERLWGLVACHHATARILPYAIRTACELVGRAMSVQISVQEETDRLRAQLEARSVQTRFYDIIAEENNFVEALVKYTPTLLEMVHANGAAILTGTRWTRLGETPGSAELDRILERIEPLAEDGVFRTDALSSIMPEAESFKAKASGLLFVSLSSAERNCILLFRPEVTSVIEWAGNPTKAVEEGTYRLHPRKSFAAWQQTVTGRSAPWRTEEIEAALELRNAFNASILQRTDRLLRLSTELERKNSDLNSFAYIAAHDLKEPVRGIHHYTSFVLEDYGQQLPEDGRQMLNTVQTLAVRIEELIGSLLHFSSVGRIKIATYPVPLDSIVDEALLMLKKRIEDEKVEIRRPATLPVAMCDRALTREVFVNLITNALKYNDKPERWIEIGSRDGAAAATADAAPAALLYVRDNGIGIREKHQQDVFAMFRRLHDRDKYGGGTGAGLAIVKTIVEKHGGEVSLESVFGEGTTFLFTLPQSAQP